MNNTQAAEYERLMLGCYLSAAPISPAIIAAVFETEAHRTIFTAIRKLREQGIQPDLLILEGELIKQGKIEAAGGYDKIAALTTGAMPSNVAFYEAEVLHEYRRRSATRAVVDLRESLENNHTPDQAIEDAIKKWTLPR
jgi:replicative DNA helicase